MPKKLTVKQNLIVYGKLYSVKNLNEKILYFKKVIYPTEKEMEMHKRYLKQNLKKRGYKGKFIVPLPQPKIIG